MAIMHVYVAPDRAVPGQLPAAAARPRAAREAAAHARRCRRSSASPSTRSARTAARTSSPPRPPAPRQFRRKATVDLRQGRFRPAHISVATGARVTWRFQDATPHNVLFANGPSLIGTPTLSGGAAHTSRFRVPGRYELFCYLHPVTMHEVVDVRPQRGPAANRGPSGSG